MKIKLKYDPEVLREQIKNELGVDLNTYIDKDALSGLVDMLILPKYALKIFFMVLLTFIVLYSGVLYNIPVFTTGWFVFLIVGVVVCLLNVITVGIFAVLANMKHDIMKVVDYVCNMCTKITTDSKSMFMQMSGNKLSSIGLLFKGIILVVINPTLCELLEKKIPVLSKLVTIPVLFVLNGTVAKIQFVLDDNDIPQTDENYSGWMALFALKIRTYALNTFNTILIPFTIPVILTLGILGLLMQGVL